MDWVETASPVALHKLKWPRDHMDVKEVFENMWSRLRQLVLHYCRGTGRPASTAATLKIANLGLEYGAYAEEVRPPDPAHNLTPRRVCLYSRACL